MPLCQICGKGVSYGNNVSHSKRRTSRRWLANVQKTTIAVDGVPVRVRICTRCMRTLEKTTK